MMFIIDASWKLDNTTKVLGTAADIFSKPAEGIDIKSSFMVIGQNRAVFIVDAEGIEAITDMHWPFLDHVKCKWYPILSLEDAFKKIKG